MNALESLAGKLQHASALSSLPGVGALKAAAERAVAATNQQLQLAHVPARAQMRPHGRGFRVNIVQTGRYDRTFSGRTPRQLLADNVRKEMQLARSQIADDARKKLRP